MARTKRQSKKITESFLVPVLLCVFVASLFVVFMHVPEQATGISPDRVLSIEGVLHEGTSVDILRLTGVENSIALMRGPVYELSVRGGGVLEQGTIQYRLPKNMWTASPSLLTLIAFDPTSLTWKAIPTTIDSQKEVASAHVSIQQTLMVGIGTKF